MRVAKGKVVGQTIVLEGDAKLPEGANVDVVLRESGDDAYELTEEMEADLDEAMQESRRGEGMSPEEFFAKLPSYVAPG